MQKEPSNTTPLSTLVGYQEVHVSLLDGTGEAVRVRQLPVKEYPAYLSALEDEAKQVELLCGKPAGWAEQLTPESYDRIAEVGDQLNADFFSRWVKRRMARQERIMPGITDKALKQAVSASPTTPQS